MNNKAKNFIKGFSYTLSSNLISLIVSTIVILIIPKLIGVEEYGYWQLYIFYASFVGFLHFGWNDGIYLRFGGAEYGELDKKLFFSQFVMLLVSQILIAIIVFIISKVLAFDVDRHFIFKMISLTLVLDNVRWMLLFILQATNRIKDFARIIMLDRIIYIILIVFFLLGGIRDYRLLIAADIIGKVISLAFAIYLCKDMVFRKLSYFYFTFKEVAINISVGIKLMFANIASILLIGVVRFGIERSWDVSTFGKISLTLSVSNLMMIFINAVGLIMFPILRRTDEKKLPSIYETMRTLLMVPLLAIIVLYYPFKVLLSTWLPQYADSLMYMALLFPICVYEGKMALLINIYLKTLRKEQLMLKINLVSLGISIMITYLTTMVLKNLGLAIVSIVIILAFRCVLSEIFLSKILGISIYKDINLELIMTMIFMLTGWFINSWFTVGLYAGAYVIYLVIKRNDITDTIKNVRLLMAD